MHITSNQSEAALLTTWNNAWSSAWTDAGHGLDALYPAGTVLEGTSVATLNGTMHEVTKTPGTLNLPGTAVGDTLPYLNATLLSLRSASVQRHARGRIFLPAMEESFVNNDVLIPASVTRVSLAAQAVKAAITADGSTIFVTNKKPLKDGTPAFGKTIITTILVSNKPARQSRRTRKIQPVYT
jgi:hypothetical protein